MVTDDECLAFRSQTLAEVDVPAWADPRARLIGLETYIAAGGKVRHDMVSAALDGAWICDIELLDRLVMAKLQRIASALRDDGWLLVEVRVSEIPRSESSRWQMVPPTRRRRHTASEKRRIRALALERNRLADQEPDDPASLSRMSLLGEEIAAIQDAAEEWDAPTRARCKVMVLLSRHGLQIIRGIAVLTAT